MKNLKFYFILLCVVFITGCDVKYNIEIYDKNISETANFKLQNNVILNNSPYYTLQQMSYKYFINSDFLIVQEKKEYSDDNYRYVDLKNNYEISGYLESYALSICYSAYNVITDDNSIKISTSNKFLCYDKFSELSSVIISVKTNHKVIEHNADEVVNDEYRWVITKDNDNNKPITFVVSKEPQQESFVENLTNNILHILIIVGCIGVIGIIVLVYVKIRSKKVNKI